MAPSLRVFCLLLLCASIVVNVESKFFGKSSKTTTRKPTSHSTQRHTNNQHNVHTTKSPYHPQVHEPIAKSSRYTVDHATQRNSYSGGAGYPSGTHPPKTSTQRHEYPSSHGQSGIGSVTSAPSVNSGYNPAFQAHYKPSQLPSSSSSNGKLSGGGFNYPTQSTASPVSKSVSYPLNNGKLSGDGINTSIRSPASQSASYPSNNGKLSGDGLNTSNRSSAFQSASYPSNNGKLSGDGFNNSVRSPASQSASYPLGNGNLSGGGTSIQTPASQPASYPSSNGKLSGVGTSIRTPVSQPASYPASNGKLSGGGTSIRTPASQPASYPSSNGNLSGGGHNQQSVPPGPSNWGTAYGNQPLSYPPGSTGVHISHGQSGGGHQPIIQNPQVVPGSHGYPHTYPGHVGSSYSDHIYVRNHHTTNNYYNNMQPTQTYHHPYRPPSHVYYTKNGHQYHYPVYKEELPVYVYEYKSSQSRFNTLLAGLALYNLGHVSKDHAARNYHNQYKPRPSEICRFGVKYNEFTREEVDIDCRLMTDFIWSLQSVKKSPMVPNIKQVLLPNGTLVRPESAQIDGFQVVDALDPRFNGAPLQIKPGMKCYMKYFDGYYVAMEKYVSCEVLQTYVQKSFNFASKITPTIFVLVTTVILAVLN